MNSDFNNKPKQNLRLEAIYEVRDRLYTVKFYNHLGDL
jgi:hypothetical protein